MDKRIRYEFHVNTLQLYRKINVAPKGLQIFVKPASSELSLENLKLWESVLSSASLKLLDIVISHNKSLLSDLLSEEAKIVAEKRLSENEMLLLEQFLEKKTTRIISEEGKKT